MPGVDSSFVLLPRFTTLVGASEFLGQALDVSAYGGVQFQVWRGPFRVASEDPVPRFRIVFEESLDTHNWVMGPTTPTEFEIGAAEPKFFSYSFRLRWFRIRIVLTGDQPIVSCWAEGLLREGGSGLWPPPGGPAGNVDIGRGIAGTSRGPSYHELLLRAWSAALGQATGGAMGTLATPQSAHP